MSDEPTKDSDEMEQRILRALADEPTPSAELEDRIVRALEQRGLIHSTRRRVVMAISKTVGIAVALGLVFLGGFTVGVKKVAGSNGGSRPEAATASIPATTDHPYMLLMFMRSQQEAPAPASDRAREAYEAIIAEYRAWADARASEGRLLSAEKLGKDTRVMTGRGEALTIAESANTDRVLGGYFLITAPSLEDAIALAKSHPHLKYGGEVEVRPIENTR